MQLPCGNRSRQMDTIRVSIWAEVPAIYRCNPWTIDKKPYADWGWVRFGELIDIAQRFAPHIPIDCKLKKSWIKVHPDRESDCRFFEVFMKLNDYGGERQEFIIIDNYKSCIREAFCSYDRRYTIPKREDFVPAKWALATLKAIKLGVVDMKESGGKRRWVNLEGKTVKLD